MAGSNSKYIMRYRKPAYNSMIGWQSESLPIGNGYFGVSFFGEIQREKLQVSDNTLWTGSTGWINNRLCSGNESFCTVYISTGHDEDDVCDYARELSLDDAVGSVRYRLKSNGVTYHRQYFCSYPSRVLVIRLWADRPQSLCVTFSLAAEGVRSQLISKDDHCAKTAEIKSRGSTISLRGHSEYFNMNYEGLLHITAEGSCAETKSLDHGRTEIKAADAVTAIFSLGTNYKASPHVFLCTDREHKLDGTPDPHVRLRRTVNRAVKQGFEALLSEHLRDFGTLFGRVKVSLGDSDRSAFCDTMLDDYRHGKENTYLHELFYQYSRYLLLSCSRKGALPAALQGVWNTYTVPPWTNGYWYNINVQMNYWNTFSGNTAEAFYAFDDFNTARMQAAEKNAAAYIKKNMPQNHEEGSGRDGWIVGTGNSPFHVGEAGGHSGPGTGGLTTQLYWDWYAFTADRSLLRRKVLPMLRGLAVFYTKCVANISGSYLSVVSSSPEQKILGNFGYVNSLGCAFDQQMIYENNLHYLMACDILGTSEKEDKELYSLVKQQIDKYDPVIIGRSGQIKEYREENYYGEIGDPIHRHISHLLGLAPGAVITRRTPAWQDAAAVSLDGRTNRCGGWALANRMYARARLGQGNEAKKAFDTLINECTFPNLWTNHDRGYEFQIDAGFGSGASIGEMLLQSHEDRAVFLPALPDEWSCGQFSGLRARGGFECSAQWQNFTPVYVTVRSDAGNRFVMQCAKGEALTVTCEGAEVKTSTEKAGEYDFSLAFNTEEGKLYTIKGFSPVRKPDRILDFKVEKKGRILEMSWSAPKEAGVFEILCAQNSAPDYRVIATVKAHTYTCTAKKEQNTFKIRFVSALDSAVSCSQTVTV